MKVDVLRQKGFLASMRSLFHYVVLALLMGGGSAWALTGPAGVSPELSALITRCAPSVHPITMAAVVSAESRGQQFALADAGPKHLPWSKRKALVRSFNFSSLAEAAGKARELIGAGHTVSLGLSQVNDRNLPRLGLSVEAVFEACTNLSAGGQILLEFYQRAVKKFGPGAQALRAALSAYNSGDWVRGEKDGYVNLVRQQVGVPLGLRAGKQGAALSGGRPVIVVPTISAGGAWWQTVDKTRRTVGKRGHGRERAFAMSGKEFVVD